MSQQSSDALLQPPPGADALLPGVAMGRRRRVGRAGFFWGKHEAAGPPGGTCPCSLGCPLGRGFLAARFGRVLEGGRGREGWSCGGARGPWLPPAPPRAAASPPPCRAHRAALPRQRQLLHAAIYSEGHLLLSVVAKALKRLHATQNSSEVTGLAAAVPKATSWGRASQPGAREDAPWVTAPWPASLQGTQAGRVTRAVLGAGRGAEPWGSPHRVPPHRQRLWPGEWCQERGTPLHPGVTRRCLAVLGHEILARPA